MFNGFFEKKFNSFRFKENQNTVFEVAHNGPALCLTTGKLGHCISGGYDQTVVVYDYYTGKTIHKWTGHQQQVTKVSYGSNCEVIASGSRDKTIKLWRYDKNEAVDTIDAHELPITGLDFNTDNTILCSGSRDNTIKLWDVSTGKLITSSKITRNLITHLKFTHNTNMIIQTSEDKELRLWDARTLQVTSCFPTKQHMQMNCDVTVNDNYILTCSNGTNGNGCESTLWDVRKCKLLREYRGHQQTVNACSFFKLSEYGHYHVVTVSQDNTLRLWSYETSECLFILTLDGSGALNDVTILDEDSLCVATYHNGLHRIIRGFLYMGQWILKKVSNF